MSKKTFVSIFGLRVASRSGYNVSRVSCRGVSTSKMYRQKHNPAILRLMTKGRKPDRPISHSITIPTIAVSLYGWYFHRGMTVCVFLNSKEV